MSDNHSFFFVVRKFPMYSLGNFEVYNTVDYNHHAVHYISINLLIFINTSCKFVSFKPRVPNLQDLMPDDLRWSWCDNNKVHNKCNVIASFPNHPSTPHLWKYCLPCNRSLVPKCWEPLWFNQNLPNSHTAASGNHHSTLCFFEFRFLYSTFMWYHTVLVFSSLAFLS